MIDYIESTSISHQYFLATEHLYIMYTGAVQNVDTSVFAVCNILISLNTQTTV